MKTETFSRQISKRKKPEAKPFHFLVNFTLSRVSILMRFTFLRVSLSFEFQFLARFNFDTFQFWHVSLLTRFIFWRVPISCEFHFLARLSFDVFHFLARSNFSRVSLVSDLSWHHECNLPILHPLVTLLMKSPAQPAKQVQNVDYGRVFSTIYADDEWLFIYSVLGVNSAKNINYFSTFLFKAPGSAIGELS